MEEKWCWGLYFLGVEKGQKLVVKLFYDRLQMFHGGLKICFFDFGYVLVVTQQTNGLTFTQNFRFGF